LNANQPYNEIIAADAVSQTTVHSGMTESAPTSSLNVLVVDDELNIRKALAACLEADGHKVHAVGTGEDALAAVNRRSFDVAFVDLFLGKDSALEIIPKLLSAGPWMKVVVITAYASVDTAVESMKRGAADYLPKPFTPAQVSLVVQKAAELRALEQRVADLQGAAGASGPPTDLATNSPAMQRAINLARQVADSDVSVLLCGESGTGKGVLARALHSWSRRAPKPFSTVACPALSPELLESELFGHIKGAFTGAVRENPGRIAASEGGTLFLDEIGDLPSRLQPKLLRFLQDRCYERVGDPVTRQADVRVITATNVDLEKAVSEGRFREDLFYRINVIRIDLPPLRERSEDIVPLAERMLVHLAVQHRRAGRTFTDAARLALRGYRWPGNVRELRNVLERAAILCLGEQVGPEQLMLSPGSTPPVGAPAIGDSITVERLEELHIRAVLASTASIEKASQILGMDTVTLWRRRKKYGI
jgi:two-component system, NtrC family, response regulator AlgB